MDPWSTEQEELLAQGQFSNTVWQSQLDPARHRPQLFNLGAGVFRVQLCDPTTKDGVVGEVCDDPLGSLGLGIGVCGGGCVLCGNLSGLDGRVQVVGDGDLQTGVRLDCMPVSPAGAWAEVWDMRVKSENKGIKNELKNQ